MAESHDLGQKGEELAVEFLKNKGFKINFRNWKWGKNEIDIVAENDEFVVFAEVKTRMEDPLEPPASAITRDKQRAIIFAAEGYVRRFMVDKDSRFDVITIIKKKDDFVIEHMVDAFYPTLR